MKLKVCGMKHKDNILDVATLHPDYLGFIFYEKSSRFFEGSIPELPESIKKVGVFVNASLEHILAKIKTYNLQVIQLHGNESVEFCRNLKRENIKIIKVFSIQEHFDFSALQPFENVCDFFLFDTKGALPGGNGYTFNWTILKDYSSTKPFFLSGGIGLDEIENLKAFEKIKVSKYCHAIDVNSKFEIEPGLKNTGLLKEFKKQILE